MKAVMCKGYGPPESLVIEDLPDPGPGAGEVLVDVTYVGLNFFDTLIIRNKYQIKPELPFSPASEFSGRVAALGAGVSGFRVGDRVCGSLGHGAARSKVVVKPNQIYAIPEGLSDERAAGLIITYGTSHHALKQRAKLRPGETLAVLGASGGVGIAAVELRVDGRARHRLRLLAGQDRLRHASRRRRGDRLFQIRSQGRVAPSDRRQGRRCGL
jgi:NADPH2:quinone reductase